MNGRDELLEEGGRRRGRGQRQTDTERVSERGGQGETGYRRRGIIEKKACFKGYRPELCSFFSIYIYNIYI